MSGLTVKDLAGRTFVVTGANTGVGRATAEALAARGGRLVLACRSASRAAAVLETIAAMGGEAELVELELGSLKSVKRGARLILERAPRIDVLVNNAGVGGARGLTEDGFELAFGVNYLGHYLLTRSLMPALRGGRVVHVISGSYLRAGGVDFEAARRRTASLTGVREYATSKLATMLFHHELARRGDVTSLAADPGEVASEGWRHVPWPARPLLTFRMKSPARGAETSAHCASAPNLRSGTSWVDCREQTPNALSKDETLARELWDWSAAWVGLAAGRESGLVA